MLNHVKIFLIVFFVFVLTDWVWLGLIAKPLYFKHYQAWLRISEGQLQLVWWSAIIVYLLFAMSIMVFVLPLANNSILYAGIYGAILGLTIYGIYNFTCLAIFKNWPVGMAFVDCAWGTFICAWSSAITLWLQQTLMTSKTI